MRIFITGASGWIGSAATDELLAAGHELTALARSDESASALRAKGVDVLRGGLDDLDTIRAGSDAAEAVVHLANKHDFVNQAVSNAAERAAVQTIGDALAGSGRRFLLAAGVAGIAGERVATEADAAPFSGPDAPRGGSENLALDFVAQGVHTVSLRFAPTVHGIGDHGFISAIAHVARARGVSGYPGTGTNRWAAVARSDAARLIVLALAQAPAGARVHAVGEEGIPTRDIAEALAASLGLPVASIPTEDVPSHFGWIGGFFAANLAASSMATQALLGWTPTGPTLIEDIAAGGYPA